MAKADSVPLTGFAGWLLSPTLIQLGVFSYLVYYYCLLNMKDPYYPQFKVESATVSNLNTQGSSLTATWDITLVAVNPSSTYKTSFDLVQAGVRYYDGVTVIELGSTPRVRHHFDLKEMKEKRFSIKVRVDREMIGDAVAQKITNDKSRGLVRFGVTLDTVGVKFKATLAPTLEEDRIGVTCDQVPFVFSGNNGTGVLISPSWC